MSKSLRPNLILVLLLCLHLNPTRSFLAASRQTTASGSAELRRISRVVLHQSSTGNSTDSRNKGRSQHNENDKDSILSLFQERLQAADLLEIRLDATIVSCHVLARFLVYDMSLPVKAVPGFEMADVIALLDTATSCATLALLWTAAGLATRLFEPSDEIPLALATTTIVAAPIWLELEQMLDWPGTTTSGLESIVVGTWGLFATMSLSRLVASKLQ